MLAPPGTLWVLPLGARPSGGAAVHLPAGSLPGSLRFARGAHVWVCAYTCVCVCTHASVSRERGPC